MPFVKRNSLVKEDAILWPPNRKVFILILGNSMIIKIYLGFGNLYKIYYPKRGNKNVVPPVTVCQEG